MNKIPAANPDKELASAYNHETSKEMVVSERDMVEAHKHVSSTATSSAQAASSLPAIEEEEAAVASDISTHDMVSQDPAINGVIAHSLSSAEMAETSSPEKKSVRFDNTSSTAGAVAVKRNSEAKTVPASGWDAYNQYLSDKAIAPKNTDVQGDVAVTITFEVARNGKPTSINVVSSPGQEFSEVAKDLIKKGSRWTFIPEGDNKATLTIVFRHD
ncbi:MAG: hypothetical protein HC896_16720 [Bacteroidales bacterium]|nr:hypothetical protein [Bacteroidales bacterium]